MNYNKVTNQILIYLNVLWYQRNIWKKTDQ